MYEIIDGSHRWKALKKLNQKTVDSFVLNVDDAQARLLTDTLNYLRGSPDNDKRGRMLAEILMGDESLTVADLALLVPKDAAQLEDLIAASDLDTAVLADLLARSSTKDVTDDDKEEEKWVTLNFSLPLEAATIVERELDRLSESLEGKAKRMRALEFMAVNSSQTPLPDSRPSKKAEGKPSKRKAT
jgi:ParB-like chromosome segregation protein Spo0J